MRFTFSLSLSRSLQQRDSLQFLRSPFVLHHVHLMLLTPHPVSLLYLSVYSPSKINTSIYVFFKNKKKQQKNWRYYILIRLKNPSKLIRDGRTATINIDWPLQQDIMDDYRKMDDVMDMDMDMDFVGSIIQNSFFWSSSYSFAKWKKPGVMVSKREWEMLARILCI